MQGRVSLNAQAGSELTIPLPQAAKALMSQELVTEPGFQKHQKHPFFTV